MAFLSFYCYDFVLGVDYFFFGSLTGLYHLLWHNSLFSWRYCRQSAQQNFYWLVIWKDAKGESDIRIASRYDDGDEVASSLARRNNLTSECRTDQTSSNLCRRRPSLLDKVISHSFYPHFWDGKNIFLLLLKFFVFRKVKKKKEKVPPIASPAVAAVGRSVGRSTTNYQVNITLITSFTADDRVWLKPPLSAVACLYWRHIEQPSSRVYFLPTKLSCAQRPGSYFLLFYWPRHLRRWSHTHTHTSTYTRIDRQTLWCHYDALKNVRSFRRVEKSFGREQEIKRCGKMLWKTTASLKKPSLDSDTLSTCCCDRNRPDE